MASTSIYSTSIYLHVRARRLQGGRRQQAGLAYGNTDEFGFKAVENRVSIHDLHATILHLLGVDHEKLTFRYAGRISG